MTEGWPGRTDGKVWTMSVAASPGIAGPSAKPTDPGTQRKSQRLLSER